MTSEQQQQSAYLLSGGRRGPCERPRVPPRGPWEIAAAAPALQKQLRLNGIWSRRPATCSVDTRVWTQPFWPPELQVSASVGSNQVQPFGVTSERVHGEQARWDQTVPCPTVSVRPEQVPQGALLLWEVLPHTSFRDGWPLPPFASNHVCQARSSQKQGYILYQKQCALHSNMEIQSI